jgi:hypothetical protein
MRRILEILFFLNILLFQVTCSSSSAQKVELAQMRPSFLRTFGVGPLRLENLVLAREKARKQKEFIMHEMDEFKQQEEEEKSRRFYSERLMPLVHGGGRTSFMRDFYSGRY